MNKDKTTFVQILDYKDVDTRYVEQYTDETLIKQIEQIEFFGGWGLVAELLKRYAKLKGYD